MTKNNAELLIALEDFISNASTQTKLRRPEVENVISYALDEIKQYPNILKVEMGARIMLLITVMTPYGESVFLYDPYLAAEMIYQEFEQEFNDRWEDEAWDKGQQSCAEERQPGLSRPKLGQGNINNQKGGGAKED